MTLEEVKQKIGQNGYSIISEKANGNNTGMMLKLNNGAIINIFNSGKVNYQGKNTEEIKNILENNATVQSVNKKVFVVYGHDHNARTQLEALLLRWKLEPIIIDKLATGGQTIIEKLEEQTDNVNFGIVLITPDDIGYARNDETTKKYRTRQNVVLEMGMLLSKLGRSKVAILVSQELPMEYPSDIQGLLYIPYEHNVDETKVSLAKTMKGVGYNISIDDL